MSRKRALLGRAEKELTNYFTGKTEITMNFNDKLQVKLINTSTTKSASVALAAGGAPVLGAVKGNGDAIRIHHHETEALNRLGFAVDAILDDLTPEEEAAGGVLFGTTERLFMESVDANLSVAHALEYLKNNPRYIRSITIQTNNKAIFTSAIEVCTVSPFHREAARSFNLNDYYSVNQYQDDKIVIPFTAEQLQWNDMLYLAINSIPAADGGSTGSAVTLIVEFY